MESSDFMKWGSRDMRSFRIAKGTVVENKDEGDGTTGMVSINIPLLGEKVLLKANVVAFMAGNDSGAFFLPEAKDEVLVAFSIEGVPCAYILGSLWSSEKKAPVSNSDKEYKNNIKKLRSKSGHEITFNDDGEGKEAKVEIRTKSGQTILLDDSLNQERIVIKDKSGKNFIKIDSSSGAITIESTAKLSITSMDMKIESKGNLSIESAGDLSIQGKPVRIN